MEDELFVRMKDAALSYFNYYLLHPSADNKKLSEKMLP